VAAGQSRSRSIRADLAVTLTPVRRVASEKMDQKFHYDIAASETFRCRTALLDGMHVTAV